MSREVKLKDLDPNNEVIAHYGKVYWGDKYIWKDNQNYQVWFNNRYIYEGPSLKKAVKVYNSIE